MGTAPRKERYCHHTEGKANLAAAPDTSAGKRKAREGISGNKGFECRSYANPTPIQEQAQ